MGCCRFDPATSSYFLFVLCLTTSSPRVSLGYASVCHLHWCVVCVCVCVALCVCVYPSHTHTRVVHLHTVTQHLARCACISPLPQHWCMCGIYARVCGIRRQTSLPMSILSRKVKALRGCHVGACVCLCVPTYTLAHTLMHLYIYVYTQATPKTWRMRRTSPLLPRLLRRMLASLISSPHSRHPVCRLCVCVRVCGLFHGAQQHNPYLSITLSVCVWVYVHPYIYAYVYVYVRTTRYDTVCVDVEERGVLCVLYVSLPCESVCVVLCIVCSCVRKEIESVRVYVYVYTYTARTRPYYLSCVRAALSLITQNISTRVEWPPRKTA